MDQQDKEFITQAIQLSVQPLYGKIDNIADKQELHKEDMDKKVHALFEFHNKLVTPILGDVKWLKIILGGCLSVVLALVGIVIKKLGWG